MSHQQVQITTGRIASLDDFAASSTLHQVGHVGHVEITGLLVRVVTTRTTLHEDRFDMVIKRDLGGGLLGLQRVIHLRSSQ